MAFTFVHVPATTVILFLQPLEARNFLVLSARPLTSFVQCVPFLASEWPWTLTAIQGYWLSTFATSSSVFLPAGLRATLLSSKPTWALRAAAIFWLAAFSAWYLAHGSAGATGSTFLEAVQDTSFTDVSTDGTLVTGTGGI